MAWSSKCTSCCGPDTKCKDPVAVGCGTKKGKIPTDMWKVWPCVNHKASGRVEKEVQGGKVMQGEMCRLKRSKNCA